MPFLRKYTGPLKTAARKRLSAIAIAVDAYFNYVTLLLQGDGTNAAQNNTFVDNSTNNFTITRNGNTTQGSFSPYGSNWSNFFDGTGDYLATANNSANLGTGDFNITFWINLTVAPSNGVPATNVYNAAGFTNGWYFYTGDGTDLSFGLGDATGASAVTATVNLIGTWHYIEVTRSGSTLSIYVDGVFAISKTNTNTGTVSGNNTKIGSRYDGTSGFITGYISNFKVVVGTAGNTANYTPPTAPATATVNTTLLTCADNRFIDDSTNNFAITKFGNTSVQRFNPFGASTAYSTSVIGGSGYFDGSGDTLTCTGTLPATGDFTLSLWVYPTSLAGYAVAIQQSGSGNTFYLYLGYADGKTDIQVGNTNYADYTAGVYKAGQWNYVQVVKQSSAYSFYVNGTALSVTDNTGNIGTTSIATGTLTVNYNTGCYITDVRIVNTALSNSVPTSPLTAVSGTTMLLSMQNAAIFDNAMMGDLETVGNAQISTSVKKYGTGSMSFDGSGDYLRSPDNLGIAFGSGDFTVEGWINLNNVTAGETKSIIFGKGNNSFGFRVGQSYLGDVNGLCIARSNILDLEYCAFTFAINTWYHVAVVRSGTTLYFFVNGIQQTTVGSGGNTYNFATPTAGFYFGANNDGNENFAGYIDDFRITKGYARYTANFTPPNQALPTFQTY
jgi:hypothetical protein